MIMRRLRKMAKRSAVMTNFEMLMIFVMMFSSLCVFIFMGV